MLRALLSPQLHRASIQHDDLTAEQKQLISGEEQEKKIGSYEEAFHAIKDATGVSDLQVIKLLHHGLMCGQPCCYGYPPLVQYCLSCSKGLAIIFWYHRSSHRIK